MQRKNSCHWAQGSPWCCCRNGLGEGMHAKSALFVGTLFVGTLYMRRCFNSFTSCCSNHYHVIECSMAVIHAYIFYLTAYIIKKKFFFFFKCTGFFIILPVVSKFSQTPGNFWEGKKDKIVNLLKAIFERGREAKCCVSAILQRTFSCAQKGLKPQNYEASGLPKVAADSQYLTVSRCLSCQTSVSSCTSAQEMMAEGVELPSPIPEAHPFDPSSEARATPSVGR